MAGPARAHVRPEQVKALPGSLEDQLYRRRHELEEAIKDAGIIPGDLYVTDTFSDRLICSSTIQNEDGSWTYQLYEVAYTLEADGYAFGDPRAVDKEYTERLVPAEETDEPPEGGFMGKAFDVRHKERSAPFHVKSLTEATDDPGGYEFKGSFSVFGIYDHSKDRVLTGATAKSTSARLPKIKDHHGVTVGQATKAYESDGEFIVEGRIYPTTAGKDLATLMQTIDTDLGPAAPVEQGSIGFSVAPGGAKKNEKGGWDFSELDIWEVSPVTFGDNDQTRIQLKGLDAVEVLPSADLLAYTAEVVDMAISGTGGVKALRRRRKADGRDLTAEQWQATDELLFGLVDGAHKLANELMDGGKAASTAHMRHTLAIVQSLADLIHGRGETPKPAPSAAAEEDQVDAGDDTKKPSTGTKPPAAAKKGVEAEEAKALREVESAYLRAEFERLARGTLTEV